MNLVATGVRELRVSQVLSNGNCGGWALDRCKGVLFTDDRTWSTDMSGYDEGAGSLGTATGTWGFDLGALSARAES